MEHTSAPVRGYVLDPGEGTILDLAAGPLVLKVDGGESGGSIAVWEDVVQPQAGPPPHVHHLADELFLVLEGNFEFLVGNERIGGPRGAFAFIPRGEVHTYRCTGATAGRLLGIVTPAGLEQFYVAQTHVPPGTMTPELYERMGREHDLDAVPTPDAPLSAHPG